MDVIKIIRENKLIYYTIDELANHLTKIIPESEDNIKQEIVALIHSGDLFLNEKGLVSISSDHGYFKARMIVNKKGYGFAQVQGYNDFFIPAFNINGAFDGDDCLVEITSKKGDDNIEGRVVKILKRNTTKVVGTYIVGKSKNVVFPDDVKLPQIRIFKNDSGKAKNNDKVWVELDMDSIDSGTVRGVILEVLGQANTPKAEQLSIIRAHNIIEQFDEKTLNNAKSIKLTVDKKDFKDRADYTEHKVITIDGEDARDFDDALSIIKNQKGGYSLFVHIADVSNYVVENSALDKEAFRRGTSVYFPNQVIPMLPKELSNGICSLKEGENRLVLTVEMQLDEKFNLLSSSIQEGIIKSSHRMTYTEVMNLIEGDELLKEKYQDVYDDIMLYRAISNRQKELRLARGEIRMNLPEPFILENEAGEIVSIEKRMQDEAHEIIESLMIMANECVAKKFYDLNIPFVYRVHEKPDSEKVNRLSTLLLNMGITNKLSLEGDKPIAYQNIINKISGTPKETTLTKFILRSMMKAKYSPSCLGHFGLASEYYCHFTSPIRRYPDLQIHRIIKNYLHGVPIEDLKLKYADIVEKASEQSSTTEKNAEETEREVNDYKKAVYMTKFIGQSFTGTISGVQEYGIFVELENGVEGLVRSEGLPMDEYIYDDLSLSLNGKQHHFTIGDEVKVIVANTNVQLRQIDFDLDGVKTSGAQVIKKNKDEKKSKKYTNSKKYTKSQKIKSKTTRKRRKK